MSKIDTLCQYRPTHFGQMILVEINSFLDNSVYDAAETNN